MHYIIIYSSGSQPGWHRPSLGVTHKISMGKGNFPLNVYKLFTTIFALILFVNLKFKLF